MRHRKKGRKIGSNSEHKKAILRNLTKQILIHEKIRTTEAKAKEVRSLVEKIITLSKNGDLNARRRAISLLGDKEVVNKIFSDIPERFKEREGGYVRILKIGPRKGDGSPIVLISLV
ncbi:MAG: 50S ribosomal protein L17 [Actinomycetia bacterium]|nr:50S ribosomal protein L17 [Actinomycetes bacterium]